MHFSVFRQIREKISAISNGICTIVAYISGEFRLIRQGAVAQ